MTLEEVIKHYEEIAEIKEKEGSLNQESFMPLNEFLRYRVECLECASEHRQLVKWLRELKSLKKKDEPKLVIYSGDGYADGKMVYDWADCPSCNFAIEESDVDWGMPYCPSCGQRLRWENDT